MQWFTHVPSVASPWHPHPPDLPQKCMFRPKTLYLGCLCATHHGLPHIIHVDSKGSSVGHAMVHPCAKCGLTLASPPTWFAPKVHDLA